MKIIHTSDWHIGQNFYRFDRDDEHKYFFDQLAEIMAAEKPDALVVSGDVFHNAAPSTSAQRQMVSGVIMLHDASPDTVIVITAGNHDSGSRLDAESQLWGRLGIHVKGGCIRREDSTFDPAQFIITVPGKGYVIAVPHIHPTSYPAATTETLREDRQREFFKLLIDSVPADALPIVMMAHLAAEGCDTAGHEDQPVGGMYKDDLSELSTGYDYLALGHIHMPQHLSDRAYYSGSPLPVSFSEDYDHYVNIVDITSRGAIPQVTKRKLLIKRKAVTIPADGAPLEEALKALEKFDDSADCYVRLLVDQDNPLDADADDRARMLTQDKACRFCEIRRKPRVIKAQSTSSIKIEEVADFKEIDPLEIARLSYERATGTPLSDKYLAMLKEAIGIKS